MKKIAINENGIQIVFGITKDNELKLLHFSSVDFDEKNLCPEENFIKEAFQLVQVSFAGYNRPYEKHGNKHIVTAPGFMLKYVGMEDLISENGRQLIITQKDDITGAKVVTTMDFYKGTSIVRMKNVVTNEGAMDQTLEYISSFCYTGIEKEGSTSTDDKIELRIPHNGWQKEMSWMTYSLPDLGFAQTQPTRYQRTSKTIEVTNTGNWSTKEYLPMGYLANKEADSSLFWQIEHNGSWHYEIGDQNRHFYLNVSGPTEIQSHWFKILKPGESFESVPVAVGVAKDNFSQAMGELTKYRRMIRRPNEDNEKLPIIFNDYMNCLFGDPTTEKELPLIDAAAKQGCEYFVIDAGWYAKGDWWDSVGEWQESRERFPNGLIEVTDYIRSKGMIPGVWLELEVMGIHCKKAKHVSDDWFFLRHGKRVFDRSRYQLDFRNPAVIDHATEVIDRVVKEYGVGYIKMDYNIEPGIGTELHADSVGQGMLEHELAYLAWLDGIFAKYPDLVIENCSSGGLRIDYALLSRYSIQSTSDQEDYANYATITANAATGVTPEQAAVWSYPQREGDLEETIYNMVNAILLRVHQSGHLAELSLERSLLVKEGLDYYKTIRNNIKNSLPYWPTDVADNRDKWLSTALYAENKMYVAVWRRGGNSNTFVVPLQKGIELSLESRGLSTASIKEVSVNCAYPKKADCQYSLDTSSNELVVTFDKEVMARLFEITMD
ncbi:MAG TPA: glycoside hydrolase family 36 protein [Lachnospiraceae bacterium]|nr:glycoside hydrolase family 36 protein [Lachnospiraceae bacterium]